MQTFLRKSSFLALSACFVLASVGAYARPHARPGGPPAAPRSDGVVNINTATTQQFELLPGIGPTKAERIIAYRNKRKHFRTPRELLRVKGIGRVTFRKLKPYVTLKGQTTLTRKVKNKRKQ